MRKLFAFILIIILTSLACNLPQNLVSVQEPPKAVSYRMITPDPNATVTPTPFQPLPITATPVYPTDTPTPEPTQPEPTQENSSIDVPGNMISILLLGSDFRPNSGFRTDVILLVIIDPATGHISMVSFPRDLYVFIPGIGQQRINTAQAYGGFGLTVQTFQYNFGITPDYYIMTNMQGFIQIVDSLGGISVNASQNLTDTCHLPQAFNGYCSFGPGEVTMNGETALWYVRSRYSTSDFDRTRRAQEVITAIFAKLMSLDGLSKIPELYQLYSSNVETDVPVDIILKLAPLAPGILSNPDRIHRYAIGPAEVWPYRTETGAQVLIPNPDAIQPILYQAYHPQ